MKQVQVLCSKKRLTENSRSYKTGVPNPRATYQYQSAEQEVSGRRAIKNFICRSPSLALPTEPSPPPPTPCPNPSVEKLSSTKPVPGAKKVGDRCYKTPRIPTLKTKECFWELRSKQHGSPQMPDFLKDCCFISVKMFLKFFCVHVLFPSIFVVTYSHFKATFLKPAT